MPPTTRYDPIDFFTTTEIHHNRVLLILNSPIPSLELLEQLWRTTRYQICADGGANRLYDFLSEWREEGEFLPSHIHGDLDSLRPDVQAFYKEQSVPVLRDPDQYSTDFGKCLKLIRELLPTTPSSQIVDIMVLGSVGGRLDHGLGLLHEFGREHDARPKYRLWLVSECSVSFVLKAGENSVIRARSEDAVLERNAGIVPLYGHGSITIKGFEWDVEDWKTSMDGQVSTSNHIVEDECEVFSDVKVLFTIERKKFC